MFTEKQIETLKLGKDLDYFAKMLDIGMVALSMDIFVLSLKLKHILMILFVVCL